MVATVAGPSHTANPSTTTAGSPPASQPLPRYRYRLRFRKAGDLRLVSHHDLMNVFERMLRRAALPVAQTQGFHPQPRLVFALSLALGVAGANEVVDLELTEPLGAEILQARLAGQAPPGLEILSAVRLEGKVSSQVRRAFYSLPLPSADGLQERYQALMQEPHLLVERTRPQPRTLDIKPYLSELTLHKDRLDLAIWVTPTGTARPEEFARFLGLDPLLTAGAYFERTGLEMMDDAAPPQLKQAPVVPSPTEITPLERIT